MSNNDLATILYEVWRSKEDPDDVPTDRAGQWYRLASFVTHSDVIQRSGASSRRLLQLEKLVNKMMELYDGEANDFPVDGIEQGTDDRSRSAIEGVR